MRSLLLALGVALLCAPASARVLETACTATLPVKADPALGYYSIIWSSDQKVFIVKNRDKLYFDRVLRVVDEYPFVVVYAVNEGGVTLKVRFISPNYVSPDATTPYPKETITTLNQKGESITDECGQGE